MSTSIIRRSTPLIATAAISLGAMLASASPAGAATIYACVKKNGAVRIVGRTTRCRSREKKLGWNSSGPAGAKGTTGEKGATGTKGATGPKGETGGKGETGPAATTLWAVVESNGNLARHGTGVVSAGSISAGQYSVTFNRNVQSCAYIATIGGATTSAPPPGEIVVASLEPTSVLVQTFELTATPPLAAAEPFHLAVFC